MKGTTYRDGNWVPARAAATGMPGLKLRLLCLLIGAQLSHPALAMDYVRAYDLGPAGHIDDLGLIGGTRHLVIQQAGQIRIITVNASGFSLKARITNPLSGDWGGMLTVIPDANGDGVDDIATYGRDSQVTGENIFYVLSGNQPAGTLISGSAAAIYSIPFGGVQPRYSSRKPNSTEILLSEFPDVVRRREATGSILQTITGNGISSGGTWIGDVDGDTVPDWLTGGKYYPHHVPLYVISGADTVDGTAEERAILTLDNPSTPELGYAEENNNIAAAFGDINGDGRSEIVVGSRFYRTGPGGTNYGRVVVFDGATGAELYSIEPDQTHQNGVYFGNNLVAPGDMNGDSIGDFIVAAQGYTSTPGGYGDGAIIGYSGVDGSELFRHYGDHELLGTYEMSLIGDLNGDGVPELAVSSLIQASIWLSGVPAPPDTTPPMILPSVVGTLGLQGWYTSNVAVSWSVTDAESTVTSTIGCGAASVTNDSGGSGFTCSATSGGGTAQSSVTVKRDATAPALVPVVSPNPLLLNGAGDPEPHASDALSGVASQSCTALDTSTVGSHASICTATDQAGNTATAVAPYTVVYGFVGFTSPVDNPGIVNVATAGQAIPFKWRLLDANGTAVTSLAAASLNAVATSCSGTEVADAVEQYAVSASDLQNLGNGYYQFNWKSPKSYANSCKQMVLDLDGGGSRTALFRFR